MQTLVLIRGWASIDYTYQKFLQNKPDGWNVIVIAADKLIYDQDLDKSAERFHEFIQEKKLKNFVLVGHSLGAAIAVAYSAKYPHLQRQIILVNPVGIPLPGKFLIESVKMFARNSGKPTSHWPVKIREAINFVKKPGFHLKLGRFARIVDVSMHTRQIDKPVLILYGDKDELVPLKTAEALQKAIKNSQLKILPGHNHDWLTFYPQIFWEILVGSDPSKI